MAFPRPLLIGFDGSDNSRAAIRAAAELVPGAPAVVASAWTSFAHAAGLGLSAAPSAIVAEASENLDQEARAEAARLAEEGASLAREAGLEATAQAPSAEPNAWSALIALADDLDARAIVVGSRGRSNLASVLLGSVSQGVVSHARRPVLVVPES